MRSAVTGLFTAASVIHSDSTLTSITSLSNSSIFTLPVCSPLSFGFSDTVSTARAPILAANFIETALRFTVSSFPSLSSIYESAAFSISALSVILYTASPVRTLPRISPMIRCFSPSLLHICGNSFIYVTIFPGISSFRISIPSPRLILSPLLSTISTRSPLLRTGLRLTTLPIFTP